ncbi:hypothetical protein ANCDUO_23796, partial [Ancylostoma duodenale]
YNKDEEAYFIDCENPLELILRIGGRDYVIEGKNFKVTVKEDECVLPIFGMDGGWFGPSWILGDPFIRQFCNIHDMKKKTIGFAKSLY